MEPDAPSVPGYRVGRRLGSGAMGTLWEAWDRDGRHVALKLADRGPRLGGDRMRRHFRREAAAVLALDHPNLVRGHAVGETAGGVPFVALEFVEGETLTRRLARAGPLSEREAVSVGFALACALEYAHARGLVHRDVKPDNVMLLAGGDVRLVDLGLAEETGLSAPGCGSPGYASPEMMTKGVVGPASDLWALGVLLAASILGHPLFPGETRQQVLQNAMHQQVTLPGQVDGRTYSAEFRLVVERLLRKDPAERYRSASQLRLDLEALREGDRPLAAILAARARLPRSRRRVALPLALAAVAAAAFGVAVTLRRQDTPAVATPPSDVAATGAPVAKPADDPDVEVTLLLLARSPDDVAGGRALLASLEGRALSADQQRRRRLLADALTATASRRAVARLEVVRRAAEERRLAGDLEGMRRALADWPPELGDTPEAREAEALAKAWTTDALSPVRAFLGDLRAALGAWKEDAPPAPEEVDGWAARVAEVRGRADFPAEERASMAELAAQLEPWHAVAGRHARQAAAQAHLDRLRAARPEERATLLAALATGEATRDTEASRAADALLRRAQAADATLAQRVAPVRGRVWAALEGGELVVRVVDVEALPRRLLAPGHTVWATGDPWAPDAAELAAHVGDAADTRAWLWVHGLPGGAPDEDPHGPLAALASRAAERARTPPGTFWVGLHAHLPLALRGRAGFPPAGGTPPDEVVRAWDAAVRRGRSGGPPTAHPRVEQARSAFLGDDFPGAWTALQAALELRPADGEVALLRSMVLARVSEPLPRRGVLLLAFAEARRAWDLDPGLRLAPRQLADLGLRLLVDAPEALSARVAEVTELAGEEVLRFGEHQPPLLRFLAQRRLAAGQHAEGLRLLRQGRQRWPNDTDLLLAAGRAEAETGDRQRALDALDRARDLLGRDLPAWAVKLSAELRSAPPR